MQIFFPKEEVQEIRATILPEVAKKFVDLGMDVTVESGLGDNVLVSDSLYADAGANICTDKTEGFAAANVVCKINKPNSDDVKNWNSSHIFNKAKDIISLIDK